MSGQGAPLNTPRDERKRRRRLRRRMLAAENSLGLLEWRELSSILHEPRGQRPEPPMEEPSKSGKWLIGGPIYFHKRRAILSPAVETIPMTAEPISSAFVSGHRHPTLPPATHYAGAVYRDDRRIVSEFLEYDSLTGHRVPRRTNPPVIEEARVRQAPRLDGTCIYMGPLSDHFGHFLLESMQRAWYLTEADPSALLLFHRRSEQANLPPFARIILAALDVDVARIRITMNDVLVSRLVLPASQFWQGIKASPGMGIAFDHVRERILKRRAGRPPTPAKVYFSRKSLSPERMSGRSRAVISNEEEAEALFRKRGYEILQPETLPFEEQVALVANATHVAGTSGSALHLMLFNDNPRTRLIELRTKPAVNQLLISAIRPSAAFHIWSLAKDSSRETAILDMEVVDQAVRQID
ncbi:MAG: glycosyltransferase family 61 protein [Reyranella sp.]|nr:MAG: glycosyltransferase family 61 protein [Reyranella sp.]TBR29900.1 MAG: glycosyltransferase family 61 protein [Reyranella sp.]